MLLSERLTSAARQLADALALPPREARLEAQVLIAHALGVNRAWLIGHDRDSLTPAQVDAVEALLQRRLAGEPVAYLLGQREFYGRPFQVTPDVLIPRPDTELLVELALARLPQGEAVNVLDIGVGSGAVAISLALERPRCRVTGVDISEAALQTARANTIYLKLDHRAGFVVCNYAAALSGPFDLVVSNPPYIRAADIAGLAPEVRNFDPLRALDGGPDGLDAYRALIPQAARLLAPHGALVVEVGQGQDGDVGGLMTAAGLAPEGPARADLAGIRRAVAGRKKPS